MNNIYDYTFDNLNEILQKNNFKPYLTKQVFKWIYEGYISDFSEMTNISKNNIDWLKSNFEIKKLKPIIIKEDVDETIKILFELDDKNKIETVIMKFNYGYSVCLTTQVGCNIGCKFCASGQLKKKRDLTVGEIVAQVVWVKEKLKEKNEELRNIVVMGIGEPFDNYENLKQFLTIVNKDLKIGARKITVSTSGIMKVMPDWIKNFPQIGLAISLHAPNDKIRSEIMPINNAYNINSIIQNIKEYTEITKRRVTFEYILLDGINDSKENAIELAGLLKNILCYVNLIPYNKVVGSEFSRSKKIKDFYDILRENNITATIRQEKGTSIDGACGQLRAKLER